MFWSAWSLTFVAFRRVSKITASPPIEPARHLAPATVQFCQAIHHLGFRLHVKFSTADPLGAGHFIYIGAPGTHLCPVVALRSNLAHRGALAGPFVVWLVHHPVTVEQVNCYLCIILSRAGAGVRVPSIPSPLARDVASGRWSTLASHSNFGSLDESGVSSGAPYRTVPVVERCPAAVGLETSGGG